MQRPLHLRGIGRGEDVLPPALEDIARRGAARGRDIERPAEMLAGVAQANASAVMRDDLVVEPAQVGELIAERRRRLVVAASETARGRSGSSKLWT